jgi:hypothetical protein
VTPRYLRCFAALDKLLNGIGPYRFQQSPTIAKGKAIQRDKRLGDEACDIVQRNRGSVVHEGGSRFQGEAACKNRQSAKQPLFAFGKQPVTPVCTENSIRRRRSKRTA